MSLTIIIKLSFAPFSKKAVSASSAKTVHTPTEKKNSENLMNQFQLHQEKP
jgi:hypothetical protein